MHTHTETHSVLILKTLCDLEHWEQDSIKKKFCWHSTTEMRLYQHQAFQLHLKHHGSFIKYSLSISYNYSWWWPNVVIRAFDTWMTVTDCNVIRLFSDVISCLMCLICVNWSTFWVFRIICWVTCMVTQPETTCGAKCLRWDSPVWLKGTSGAVLYPTWGVKACFHGNVTDSCFAVCEFLSLLSFKLN